jgi:hypothetical protein
MFLLGKGCRMNVDSITYHSILGRFKELEYLFKLQKERKYFPSLRYTSIRLLWEHGIEHDFKIDCLLTKARKEALDDFWDRYFMV